MERRLRYSFLIVICFQQTCFITTECRLSSGFLTAVRNERRTFTSPNYPGNYPSDSEYVWRIRAELEGDVVQIITRDSHLEQKIGTEQCTFDYIQVFDGSGQVSPKLREWCGTSRPTVISTGQFLTVLFRSDSTHSETGFSIEYVAIKPGTSDGNSKSGISLMAMVGYMVLVMALLSIAMIVLRITLTKTKLCKVFGGRSRRNIFRRRQNLRNCVSGLTVSGGNDVYTIPMEPPPYEEIDLSLSPPPYSEIFDPSDPEINSPYSEINQTGSEINPPISEMNSTNPTIDPSNSEIIHQYSEVNPSQPERASENLSHDTSLVSSVGAHNESLPPSYDSLVSADTSDLRPSTVANNGPNSVTLPQS